MTSQPADRQNILGVGVSAINMPQAVAQISTWIEDHSSQYVCVTPAHGIMDCYYDPGLKKIFNYSGMTTPDGMAIVWLLKLYGHQHVSRVYGPDLLLATCQAGLEKGWRHYFYGGQPGIAEKLAAVLTEQFPGLHVAGTFTPPFRPLTDPEAQEVEETIRSAHPDIIWVGLSTPKQEVWMSEFVHRLDVPVMVGVGAAYDFLTGEKRQAPRWMQRSGLEWLFRFISEPRRLWHRYRHYPKFVMLAVGQLIGILNFTNKEA